MTDRILSRLRIFASALALIAYGLLIHGNVALGIIVALIGQIAFFPWSIHNRVWDMVALNAFYIVIGLTRLTTR